MDELMKPGEVCHAAAEFAGHPLGDPCPHCGHVIGVHSYHRGCAGCEAIAEAIKAAIKAVTHG
jgi:hypothetical protein